MVTFSDGGIDIETAEQQNMSGETSTSANEATSLVPLKRREGVRKGPYLGSNHKKNHLKQSLFEKAYFHSGKGITWKALATSLVRNNGSFHKTAKELKTSYMQISRHIHNEDLVRLVQEESKRMMMSLPAAVDSVEQLVQELSTKETRMLMEDTDKKIAANFATQVLKSAGLVPGDSMSVHIQNTFNTQVNQIVPPIVAELLAKHLGGLKIQDGEIDKEEDYVDICD